MRTRAAWRRTTIATDRGAGSCGEGAVLDDRIAVGGKPALRSQVADEVPVESMTSLSKAQLHVGDVYSSGAGGISKVMQTLGIQIPQYLTPNCSGVSRAL